MLPIVAPFLAGVIVSPLAKRIVTPLARGAVKTSVGLALDVKYASLKARDGMRDAAAEATGKKDAPEIAVQDSTDESRHSQTRTGTAKGH
jgi:hypothetical protein